MTLCHGCKSLRDIVHIDQADRPYCASCAVVVPSIQVVSLMEFLANTVPYKEGDIVSYKTGAQVYEGIGHVVQVSFSPEDLASPVVPMFRIVMDEKVSPEVP